MSCPKCSTNLTGNEGFCPNCGINLNEINIDTDNQIQNNNSTIQSQYSFQQFDNNTKINNNKPRKKTKRILLLLAVFILIGFSCAIGFNCYLKYKNGKVKNNEISEETTKYNSLEKIKLDYQNGNLSINDYFTQLVYLQFDSDKLDKKYVSDYQFSVGVNQLDIESIIDENLEELNSDIVNFYIQNRMLLNVTLGENNSVKTQSEQSNTNNEYHVQLLDDEEDTAYEHNLNKVMISKNSNFILWYTDSGKDAITKNQAEEIANTLEDTISLYENYFNIKYTYNSYIDNKLFTDDWKNAKEVLKNNNISSDLLNTAMSVYIYDINSEYTDAFYSDENTAYKILNRIMFSFDLFDEDGYVNYPHIVINSTKINSNSIDSLIQVSNHELFHHFQNLFCKESSGKHCSTELNFHEAMANFASSIVSEVSGTNNFLNNWAGGYTISTSEKLRDMSDKGGQVGYIIFPYFYSYSLKNKDWANVLMNAHIQSDPFKYVQDNTSVDVLVDTINDLAYSTISQNYSNKNLISNKGISYKAELNENENYDLTINAGAIDYFELIKNTNTVINIDKNEYVTINVYGYKNGSYDKLTSAKETLEIDESLFKGYDKFYLCITNGNLIDSYNYTINIGTGYAEKSEYKTSFKNYNIEIIMNTKVSGVEIEQRSSGVVDELHQREYLNVKTTTMGITVSNKIYYDFSTNYTYMTQSYGDDTWFKEKGTSQIIDLGNIFSKLDSMNNVTKVSNNHYKVKMTKDDVEGLMSSANSNTSVINGDVYIDVYIKDDYIVKLEYDFTKMVSGFELFTTTINISNYDNAGDVEIPKSIIDNAKDMQ